MAETSRQSVEGMWIGDNMDLEVCNPRADFTDMFACQMERMGSGRSISESFPTIPTSLSLR
jgi:hypothetical protein